MGEGKRRWLWVAALALIVTPLLAPAQSPAELRSNGMQISVRTLGYEQAASFYLARGLPDALVQRYAGACVIHVFLQNNATETSMSIRLKDWLVEPEHGIVQKIRGRSDWLAELNHSAVEPAGRMAFEWAQLPEAAELHPGDSIQGMLSTPVRRDSTFSLRARWHAVEKGHEGRIEKLRCD